MQSSVMGADADYVTFIEVRFVKLTWIILHNDPSFGAIVDTKIPIKIQPTTKITEVIVVIMAFYYSNYSFNSFVSSTGLS